MTLAALLAKAKKATPQPVSRSKWADYLPVIDELMAQKFNLWGSVAWLVQQGEIPKEKFRNCYNSLSEVLRRRSERNKS